MSEKTIKIVHWLSNRVLYEAKAAGLRTALEEAVRKGADLTGAYLTGAYLKGAYLTGAYLAGAYLKGADLTGAYLKGADLKGAYLTGADLTGAYLKGADLTGADLTGAYLKGAYLKGAKGITPYAVTPLLMLHDQIGKIRAYKLINKDGEGPYYGGITYMIGGTYSVKDADADVNRHCGPGINLASLDWCIKDWSAGMRILIAEFTAKDIAAIPTGTDGKFRVKRCKIVGEKNLKELGLEKK